MCTSNYLQDLRVNPKKDAEIQIFTNLVNLSKSICSSAAKINTDEKIIHYEHVYTCVYIYCIYIVCMQEHTCQLLSTT